MTQRPINTLINESYNEYKAVRGCHVDFIRNLKKSPLKALHSLETHTNETREGLRNRVNFYVKNPAVDTIIKHARHDVSLYSVLDVEGAELPVKCRFDSINIKEGYIVSYLTTSDASPDSFSIEAGKQALHIKAAFYCYVAEKAFNRPFNMFYVAMEENAPYDNAAYYVGAELKLTGENELSTLLPAAAYLNKGGKGGSYEAFTTNAMGFHSLSIPDEYTQPREFNFLNDLNSNSHE